MRLVIDKTGSISCLHSDEIDLTSLGRLIVTRASDVEFDPFNQEWCVYAASKLDPFGVERGSINPLFRSPSRAECLAWERDHFEAKL